MIKKINQFIVCGILLASFFGNAQETVNGSDVNSFIIGGGQETKPATLFLNPVAILDIYQLGATGGGTSILLEAGLPFSGGSGDTMPDIWLNYTYRPISPTNVSEIWIRTSQPIPAGVTLMAMIVEKSVGGNFVDRGVNNNINVDVNNTKIVKSFGAGYTDDDVTNGYKIQYSYSNTSGNPLPPGFSIIYEIIEK